MIYVVVSIAAFALFLVINSGKKKVYNINSHEPKDSRPDIKKLRPDFDDGIGGHRPQPSLKGNPDLSLHEGNMRKSFCTVRSEDMIHPPKDWTPPAMTKTPITVPIEVSVEALNIEEGQIILLRNARHELFKVLSERIHSSKLKDVLIIGLAPGEDITRLNEKGMNEFGWYKKSVEKDGD